MRQTKRAQSLAGVGESGGGVSRCTGSGGMGIIKAAIGGRTNQFIEENVMKKLVRKYKEGHWQYRWVGGSSEDVECKAG